MREDTPCEIPEFTLQDPTPLLSLFFLISSRFQTGRKDSVVSESHSSWHIFGDWLTQSSEIVWQYTSAILTAVSFLICSKYEQVSFLNEREDFTKTEFLSFYRCWNNSPLSKVWNQTEEHQRDLKQLSTQHKPNGHCKCTHGCCGQGVLPAVSWRWEARCIKRLGTFWVHCLRWTPCGKDLAS
jgi:hypothetical protein